MDNPHRPWLGAAIAIIVALVLMASSMMIDPGFHAAYISGGLMTTVALLAAALATLACGASVWRAATGDVPGAVALAWAGVPWLLSVPSAMSLGDGVVTLALLADVYAKELTVAAIGAQLASVLLISAALGLSVVAATQARGRPTRLALHAVLAIVPLWLVLLLGVNAGLSSHDAIRLAVFTIVASVAGGLAVAAVSVEKPGSTGIALMAALGVAVAGIGVIDAIRMWPALEVLRGAYDAFADATPAAHLGLALRLAAFAPLAVVATVLMARRRGDRVVGAGATPAVGVSESSPSISVPGVVVSTIAIVVVVVGPIANRFALASTAATVQRAVQPEFETEIKAKQPPALDSVVLPLATSADEIARALKAPHFESSFAIVARWPQLFDSDDVRAVPLLQPLVVDEPYRGVVIPTVEEPSGKQQPLAPAASVRDLLRAVVDARARGFEPVLLRSVRRADGALEAASRELELLLDKGKSAIVACATQRSHGLWGVPTVRVVVEDGVVASVTTDEKAASGGDAPLQECLVTISKEWRFFTPGRHDIAVPIKFLVGRGAADSRPPPPPPPPNYDALPPLKPVDVLVVVKENLATIQRCGEQAGESGIVKVQWEITKAGRAKNVRIAGRLGGTALGKCIEKAIAGWTFPSSSTGAPDVKYPFKL